jgi:hypothetical protein
VKIKLGYKYTPGHHEEAEEIDKAKEGTIQYPSFCIGDNAGEYTDYDIPKLNKMGIGAVGKADITFQIKQIETCEESDPRRKHYELEVLDIEFEENDKTRVKEIEKGLKGGDK